MWYDAVVRHGAGLNNQKEGQMATTERETLTTGVGTLMWVNMEGQGKLDYNGDKREYVASVVLPAKHAKKVLDKIRAYYDKNSEPKDRLRSCGYKRCDADGTTNEEGDHYSFNFKTRTVFPDGKQKVIQVYNASGAKVDLNGAKVANGSRGAISGVMGFYRKGLDAGVSLYLNKVQIVEFTPYNGMDDEDPFDSHEGDFEGVPGGFESASGEEKATAKPEL